ncbi:TITIN-like protein [Mya arenaria]|uniref:TITIN-like protein n=1 Tax=Mya arenaria TaxID=6604 RepID=A0ABY7DBB3_MYAAR|nr:TITIN-like protein [Mya arenaria]
MELYGYIITLAGISCIPLAAAQNLAALLGSLGGLGFGGDGPSFNMQMGGGGGGGNSNCPYQAHPDRIKFTQIVNNRQMTQNCAPGTLFDVSKCSCVNAPKTSPGGGPMPGSNPRLAASFGGFGGGGGGSGDISQLLGMLQQLQGGGGSGGGAPRLQQQRRQPSPTPVFRPTQRPHINTRAPEQNLQGGLSLDLQFPGNGQWANPIKYNPGLGLTPVVDPTILPDVLPPAVLDALKKATRPPGQTKAPTRPTAKPTIPQSTKPGHLPSTNPGQLPANVIDMLNRASSPPSQRPSSKTTKKPTKQNDTKMVGSTSLPNKSTSAGSLPPNVLRMLQQANSAAKPNSPRPTSKPMPTKRPTAPRPTGPQIPAGGDPMAALLAQLQAHMAKTSQPSASVPAQTRIQQPSRQPAKRPSGGAPDLSQLAGLLGGSGGLMGGSGGLMGGSGGPDLASLLGSLGNPLGNTGGNMGGNSPSAPGGMLDFNSLSGNLNVAALMGETPGPSLGQNLDMTSFFNTQGKMGAGGGLAGLQNLNIAKLQQLDRQGVIDISDLSPAGLAAANAHFG